MRQVYEACGYRVYQRAALPGATVPHYDIMNPKGQRITTVRSAQGYKRVIRKAAGINACEDCGCLPGAHHAAIAPHTYRVLCDERATRLWQYCNQRYMTAPRGTREARIYKYADFWAAMIARIQREMFVDRSSAGIAAGCGTHKHCTQTPSQVAASIRRRERELS